MRSDTPHIEVLHDRNTGKYSIAVSCGADRIFIRDEPILADAIQIAQRAANDLGIKVIEKVM